MGQEPDQIKQDIERTRRELGENMDLLTEKVSPGKVVERNVHKATAGVSGLKDKVMGSASDATSSVGSSASDAPAAITRKTEGNPLAAGVIAFGVGWLVSSLIPASAPERKATTALKDKASDVAGPLQEKVGEVARDLKDELAEPARQSAEAVTSKAKDAAGEVKEQATSSSSKSGSSY